MNFDYTDDQKSLRHTARKFADDNIRPYAADWDRTAEFPLDIIPKLVDMGYMAPILPEQYGGSGLDYIGYAILTEEINAACSSVRTMMSVHAGLAASAILQWGTDEQKDYFLPKMVTAELIGCFGLVEPDAGSWTVNITTSAVEDGDDLIVNGTKTWISSGQLMNLALVFAQTDPSLKHKGIVALLVEKGTDGFSVGGDLEKMGARANHATELVFENCRVPKKNILGKIGDGFKIAMSALDNGRYSVAAGAVGVAQECLDISVKHAKERITFGVPIGQHQLIKQKIAQMTTDIDSARLLVYRAGFLKDKGVRNTRETSMAKWVATEIAIRAASETMQILGANGYATEFPVERMYRDIRVTTIYEGTSEIQQLIISGFDLGLTREGNVPGQRPKEPGETV